MNLPRMHKVCQWCGQPLAFVGGQGYVHSGGGLYVQRCDECGWTGSKPLAWEPCPSCGSGRLRDDHCALAVEARR